MVEDSWLIYGLKCDHSAEYRYVGMTKGTSAKRLKEHLAKARHETILEFSTTSN